MADKKDGTIIIPCTCKSEFQDKEHGKGQRVANLKSKGDEATCTVCGREVRT